MNIFECDGPAGLPAGFLELPQLVYKDDPCWIPEDPESVAAAFCEQNSYFANCRARTFCLPGKVRAAAFFDPELRIEGERVAYAGYFESVADEEADVAVFARIESWASACGATVLYGPIQFNTTHSYRLRLSVPPGSIPFPGEPYNPPSYPAQWEALGFKRARRYVSQLVPRDVLRQALALLHPVREALLGQGYRFEVPTVSSWLQHLPQIYEMTDSIFSQNFAYSKLSYQNFAALFAPTIMHRICQRSSVLVLAPDGSPAAYGLSYPHYGPLVVQGRGAARVAVRELDYQLHAPLLADLRPRCCIGKTLGVHPAHRRQGIKEALFLLGFERSLDAYDLWYAATIREDNPSYRVFAKVAVAEHSYALYAKRLGGQP